MSDQNARGKLKYESPGLVPLGEMAKAYGACASGSTVTTDCTAGYTATQDCTAGTAATRACTAGTSATAACTAGTAY